MTLKIITAMKFGITLSFVFSLFFSALFSSNLFAQKIVVTDPPRGTTLTYTVGLLTGTLDDTKATEIHLRNPRIHKKEDEFVVGQAYKGRFKVLAPLRSGENTLVLTCGKAKTTFKLRYKRNDNPYKVMLVCLTDSSGSMEIQLNDPNDSKDMVAKVRTAGKLIQTMTAERMKDLGYGRRTFNLQLDDNDEVHVNVVKADDVSFEQFSLMNGNALFGKAGHFVRKHFNTGMDRFLVIPAFSRKVNGRDVGHAALGGGAIALFGGGTLYAWPENIEKALYAMIDSRRVDSGRVRNDSGGRDTYWANASTCIGCCLHELGHTFGLPHSTVRTDIMTRGHDNFFRVFLLSEAPAKNHPNSSWDVDPKSTAEFAPPSASRLIVSPWFANDDPRKWPKKKIEFKNDSEKKMILVRAESGVQRPTTYSRIGTSAGNLGNFGRQHRRCRERCNLPLERPNAPIGEVTDRGRCLSLQKPFLQSRGTRHEFAATCRKLQGSFLIAIAVARFYAVEISLRECVG